MRAFLAILATHACGGSNETEPKTAYVDGGAYALTIHPTSTTEQEEMFEEAETLQLVVEQADGSTTTHTLSGSASTQSPSNDTVPPLDNAVLTLLGRRGSTVVYHGRTPPLTVSEGSHDIDVFVARNGRPAELLPLPTPTALAPLVSTGNGKFYMFGGTDNGVRDDVASNRIIGIDLSLFPSGATEPEPFTLDTELPFSEVGTGWVGHTATLITGTSERAGEVLLAGGSPYVLSGNGTVLIGHNHATDATYRFAPDDHSITPIEPLAHKRFGHSATSNHRGEVVVVGGFSQHDTSVQMAEFIEIYDPESDTWSTRTDALTAGAMFHGSARLGQQGILVCGGLTGQFEYTNECQLITPNGVVESADPMPIPLVWAHMTTLASGSVLLSGGLDATNEEFDSFWNIDLPASDRAWLLEGGRWREIEPMRNARAMHTATVLAGGKVLIAGGVTGIDPDAERVGAGFSGLLYDHAQALACAELFDPETESFVAVDPCGPATPTATLPERTALPAMATDASYGTLIAGGIGVDRGNSVDGIILFHPSYVDSE